jgi:UDP-glucose 4-epimerase
MTTPLRWIIGRGLLGSAIDRARSDSAFHVRVDWSDSSGALASLTAGLEEFLRQAETDGGPWEIYWSAGRGVTSTPRAVVMGEAELYRRFLDTVAARTENRTQGVFFLGSSVGGAYAGSSRPPYSEDTVPVAISPYGEAKLHMENSLRSFAHGTEHRGFIARVTNLYGPGQDLGKGQGLISVIVDGYVTGRPVKVYVSLDTLRDYIYVDDCARVISAAMTRARKESPGSVVTKIVGSMTALSIGAILGEISRLRRKPVPLILGQGNAQGQALDLRVRSNVWPDLDGLVSTTLPAGLGAVYQAQLRSHMLAAR